MPYDLQVNPHDLQVLCPVGRDVEECKREVDLSIQRLFYWGTYADKYGGQVQVRSCDDHVTLLIEFSYEYQQCPDPSIPSYSLPSSSSYLLPPLLLFPLPPHPSQETTLYGCTVRINEPVGVIGIACPDESPLLAFVSLFAPAVVRGNTIIIIPSEKYPLSAMDLYQVSWGGSLVPRPTPFFLFFGFC